MKEKKKHNINYVLIGTVAGALGLTAFSYWFFKGRKGVDVKDTGNDLFQKLSQHKENNGGNQPPANSSPKPNPKPTADKTSFPLKKGDKGTLIKHLQETLIEKYGAEILPKFGADGDFETELLAALKSKGFPSVIDEATYKKILSGGEAPDENSTASNTESIMPPATKTKNLSVKQGIDVAKNIWLSSTLKKLPEMVAQLKRMHGTQDYKTVNNLFKTIRTNGVHQTIVNAVLNTFSGDDTSKHVVTNEFLRIGLKYDGDKWNLSGIEPRQIMTHRTTNVRNLEGIELEVPAQTLLGEHLSERNHLTAFRTLDNHILYVPTKDISHV